MFRARKSPAMVTHGKIREILDSQERKFLERTMFRISAPFCFFLGLLGARDGFVNDALLQ